MTCWQKISGIKAQSGSSCNKLYIIYPPKRLPRKTLWQNIAGYAEQPSNRCIERFNGVMSFFEYCDQRINSCLRLVVLSFLIIPGLGDAIAAKVDTPTTAEGGEVKRSYELDGLKYARYIYQRDKNSSDYSQKYAVNCHFLAYSHNIFGITGYAYSTYKVNHCDPDRFIKLTAASAKAQLRSVVDFDYIILTGPHIQMMDKNFTPVESRFFGVGSLNFTKMGTFNVRFWDRVQHKLNARKGLTYTPVNLQEDVYYVWYANSLLYKIITDEGRVFVLTNLSSHSTIGSDNDIELFARNVGEQINLPQGWVYKVEPVKRVFVVKNIATTNQRTTRLVDDFGNYYIEIDPADLRG